MSGSDDVLASLANGSAVASGAFTVDRDKARDKLRDFQLADPCGWLLEAARAAIVVGAKAIHVETDSDDVHIRFSGAPFTDEDIQELYAALLAKKAPPARQHLAVALNGAMALGPRFVRMTTDTGLALEMRPNQPDRIERMTKVEPAKIAGQATHIWVREPFHAGRFVEFFRSLTGTKREIRALERACRFLTIPVHVNGALVSRKPPAHDARADVDTPECVGTVFLSHDPSRDRGGGNIVLLHRGVVLEVLEHEMMPRHVIGIVEAKGIDRDASLGAFHRSPAFWTVIDKVLRTALALVEAPSPDDGKAAERTRVAVRAFGKAVIDGELGRHNAATAGLHSVAAALLARERPLRTAPVFTDVRGEPVSLNALCAEIELRGKVPVSAVPARGVVALERLVVHAPGGADRELLATLLGDRSESGVELVVAAEERARTRARFASRRGPTTLPPGTWLARRTQEASAKSAVAFELGLRENGPKGLAVTFFVDGCLACTKILPCPLSGIAIAIEAAFELLPSCDDVAIDATFVRALRTAWCAIPALYEEAMAAAIEDRVRDDDRSALFDGAMWLLAWSLDPEALWQTFVMGVPGVQHVSEGLAPLPALSLTGPTAHSLVQLRILRRADGTRASIAELPRPIPVVPWEVTSCSKGDAIRASATLRGLLGSFAELEVHDELALREQRRFTILQAPPARDPGWSSTKSFGAPPLHGILSASTIPGLVIYVRIQGRPVTAIIMADAPVGPLSAIVDDADLLPLADGGVAEDDQHRHALIALSALPALLGDLRNAPSGRALALALVRSLFPTTALRRAADVLDAETWLDLLAYVLADLDDKNATLELVLEAGERPTVAALERFAVAAGGATSPSDAASDAARDTASAATGHEAAGKAARQVELRLAPFGGRAAFLKAAREAASTSSPILGAVIDRVPALGRLGFRTLDGRVIDVTAMASRDELRYVPKEMGRVGTESDGVLVLTDEVRPALVTLLGAKRFVDVSEELRKVSARREFEAREVETPRLDINGHTIVIDIDDEAGPGRPRIRGQVGLLPLRSGATTCATVRVLRGGRTVMRHDLSAGAPCSFAAIIDDPELPMLADFSAPSSPGHLAKLFALCIAAAEQGIATCVERYEAKGDDDCRRIVLERLARLKVVSLPQKKARGLRAVKIFDTIPRIDEGASRASVADALAAMRDGQVRFVGWTDAKRQTSELVLVFFANAIEQTLAQHALDVPLVDAGPLFEREDRVRKQREALAPLPDVPDDALVTVESTAGRASIRAWIPRTLPRASRRVVHGGAEGKHVRDADLDVPLHAFAAVLEGSELVNDEWSSVAIESAFPELDDAALALGHALVDASDDTHASDDVVDGVRELAISIALKRHRLTPKWVPLCERAMALRLFAVGDGAQITLAQALADRPPSLEKMLRAAGLVAELDAPAKPAAAPMVPTPVALPPPPPPPELVLSQRIAETLALVKLERDAETELARWPVSCERRGGKRAVTIGKNATLVDLEHPLAKGALVDDGDPAAFFMLCAVVYGAVNAHLHAVTDDHERAFLTRLIDHARSAR